MMSVTAKPITPTVIIYVLSKTLPGLVRAVYNFLQSVAGARAPKGARPQLSAKVIKLFFFVTGGVAK
jgi:hypothetical protein